MKPQQRHLGGLPFHLTLAALEWMSLNAALTSTSAGLPFWKPPLSLLPGLRSPANAFAQWEKPLADPLSSAAALKNETNARFRGLIEGIHAYQEQPSQTLGTHEEVVAQAGGARLLYFPPIGVTKKTSIFLVPSLINRYTILDLTPQLSLARFLQLEGFSCYIVDWGTPTPEDGQKDCSHYVCDILIPLLSWAKKHSRNKMVLTGYCMGGILALAAAQLKPGLLDALALFATPWDFHSPDFFRIPLSENALAAWRDFSSRTPLLCADSVQMLFYASNPWVFHDKFRKFAHADPCTASAKDFLAIEQWVNDGVPLTGAVVQECLIGWVHENRLAKKEWCVGGVPIDPAKARHPAFIAAPQDDRIVPTGCALPLAALLPGARLVMPPSGHVGMVVGHQRKPALWGPFAKWAFEIA